MKKSSNKAPYFDKFDNNYYTTGGYDDYLTRFEKEGQDIVQKLIKVIAPDPDWCFLDVGCGMGGIILALRNLGFKARGTEVSAYCLEFSPVKKWIKKGNVCKIPYEDASFNVVLCIDVLCYLNKKEV
ncbi:MAG: class I SAM-dependent methyltransferase, partial [Microgenomates group bacterium]